MIIVSDGKGAATGHRKCPYPFSFTASQDYSEKRPTTCLHGNRGYI